MTTRIYRHVKGTEENVPVLTFVNARFLHMERPEAELAQMLHDDERNPDVVYFDQHNNVLSSTEVGDFAFYALRGKWPRNHPRSLESIPNKNQRGREARR